MKPSLASEAATGTAKMLDRLRIPDLTFPDVAYGAKETPWDLAILLYRGGAAARTKQVEMLIASGALGDPELDRLELVSGLHAEINAALAGGNSRETAADQIKTLRGLFSFADDASLKLTVSTIAETYCAWGDFLLHRTRLKIKPQKKSSRSKRPLTMRSAYNYAAVVGTLLDRVLQRHTRIIELTRLRWTSRRKSAVGVQAEKQNLEDTFAFGHMLQDLCDRLPTSVVLGAQLPFEIKLRTGECFASSSTRPLPLGADVDANVGGRHFLVNLRIETELMMFIGQTGMNAAQASGLTLRHFSYTSHNDGYEVSEYKRRAKRKVLFEIFKEYKSHFERYLEWRRTLFLESNRLLFPFIRFDCRQDVRFGAGRLRAICRKLNRPFVGPRQLRNTRVTWLLRRTGDPDTTAEMDQHAKRTLLHIYHRPSLQRAMAESTRFWAMVDPHLTKTESVAPGECTGRPKQEAEIAAKAPKPNCARKSGCLWCEDHRDLDSFEYVWAMASFQQLKLYELTKLGSGKFDDDVTPAQLVVDRIQEKLEWFEQSSEIHREWVVEARARVAEGWYHPDFEIELAEQEGSL
ncbi:site-specific integrase [Caballeronia novacaledonica]|uniref:site-specific integrase n=1 Tax=Caballeronia novacaledonica TaxID=1544861 RepID=UPI001EE1D351|nr:site-specific integrase [Caballeronia novacaledonica]